MKTAKEIASKVIDSNQRQYPVGKAQQVILDALNIRNCNGHSHAQQIFDELGITVASKREGRKSVPVVNLNTIGGRFNRYGEGEESYTPSDYVDLTAIQQYIER